MAFTRKSIHVGKVIAEVAEEGCVVGLPVLCLGEAAHAVADLNRLHLLVRNPTCTRTPVHTLPVRADTGRTGGPGRG
ncbi:MAG: hypothetical protein IRY92_05455 [Dactylosporangium sp.]|nr:hypothetical protein [Dactylosporangium sp.]